MASGIVGQLHVGDALQIVADGAGQIPLHDLHVINVVLHPEIVPPRPCLQVQPLGGAVEVEAGNVLGVDRFGEQADVLPAQCIGSEAQVFQQRAPQGVLRHPRGADARQAVELSAVQRLGEFDGAPHPLLELVHPIRQHRDAPLARVPVARGQVEQHLGQSVFTQLLRQLFRRVIVGEEILHSLEAKGGGPPEALQEVHLAEQHG